MPMTAGPEWSTPLLTQFLSLPLEDDSSAADILSRFLHRREAAVEGVPELPLALGVNEIEEARDAQELARSVLTAVAGGLPIRTRDLAEIENGAQRFERRLGYTHAHLTVTDVSGELALLTEAVMPATIFLAHDGRPVQRLLADIFRELKFALGAHLSFRVCPTCGVPHRDDLYSPHICRSAPVKASSALPHGIRPLPRTAADEIGAEDFDSDTIYGVITDPPSLDALDDELAPAAAHASTLLEMPAFAQAAPKRRSRADGSPTPAKRSARAGKPAAQNGSGRLKDPGYWENL